MSSVGDGKKLKTENVVCNSNFRLIFRPTRLRPEISSFRASIKLIIIINVVDWLGWWWNVFVLELLLAIKVRKLIVGEARVASPFDLIFDGKFINFRRVSSNLFDVNFVGLLDFLCLLCLCMP